MTEQHPITPPPELVDKWATMLEYCEDIDIFTDVVRWGADTELEACCEVLRQKGVPAWSILRSNRRPKPQSLKEQALEAFERCSNDGYLKANQVDVIRRALEALPDS